MAHAGEVEGGVEPADFVERDGEGVFHGEGQVVEGGGEGALGGFLADAENFWRGHALAGNRLVEAGAERDGSGEVRAGGAPDDGMMAAGGRGFDGGVKGGEGRRGADAEERGEAAAAGLQAGLAEFAREFERAGEAVDLEQAVEVFGGAVSLADEGKLEVLEGGDDMATEEVDERGLVADAAGLRHFLEAERMGVAAAGEGGIVRLEEEREPGG